MGVQYEARIFQRESVFLVKNSLALVNETISRLTLLRSRIQLALVMRALVMMLMSNEPPWMPTASAPPPLLSHGPWAKRVCFRP
ncbi:hypothetical protein Y032_0100g3321 [Ancylostoma ceylanicum]|uniref:Uncharacterized protein n=1 Tax=Ancylostoma ceylanicum TaxID=53326 RepID=A0A016THM1_9BILA|nr:hypothetical protein Y032_0100g3321 [Ancylostoma ceylanicum]